MKFDDLDKAMRVYETTHDVCVLPGIYIVARIDGRSFTHLTKETCDFEAPFDERFRDLMIDTVKHLMDCGFQTIYGYTESDEISLLFSLKESSFSRKHRKFNSILAAEAAGTFSVKLGIPAAFDCRVCELPTRQNVIDYFRWRMEDAHRNALNSHCYWQLRKDGMTAKMATSRMANMSKSDKNELLFSYGINFNDLPAWQKRGVGFYYKNIEHEGFNPLTQENTVSSRRALFVDMDLPFGDAYSNKISEILEADGENNI